MLTSRRVADLADNLKLLLDKEWHRFVRQYTTISLLLSSQMGTAV